MGEDMREGGFDPLAGLTIKDDHLRRVLKGEEFLLFDGAMGTMLQEAGLEAGELPELLDLNDPVAITGIHKAYCEAGAEAITTNTFGANRRKLADAASVEEVFSAAVSCVRRSGARYVVADIGPTGGLLQPLGTMTFEEAYSLFQEQVMAAVEAGADIILIETMTDLLETKAAVLAAKENSHLPIFATMTFEEDGVTFLGTSPEVAACALSALGVQALGMNCSLGPDKVASLVERMIPWSRCPVMVQANAGLPRIENGRTVFGISAQGYAEAVGPMLDRGVSIVGGCCGTDPTYIELLRGMLDRRDAPAQRQQKAAFSVTSGQSIVSLPLGADGIAIIGERINPTGKPKLKDALRQADFDYLVTEALDQADAGTDILDVNVGLPEIDERSVLVQTVRRLQAVTPLPLQIDSSDPDSLAAAVRIYAGKPLINSVNAKSESLSKILPIAKHNGCAVVGLTLDEQGIPSSAEKRFELARRIVEAAEAQGIPRADVVIDCLVMAASTNQHEVGEILRAVRMVTDRLGVKTMLGVSNISFGLPQRELINATFLSAALGCGLSLPILNPLSRRYMDTVAAARILNAQDEGASAFICSYANAADPYMQKSSSLPCEMASQAAPGAGDTSEPDTADVERLVLAGRKGEMARTIDLLLIDHEAMDIIDGLLIPALDEVGARFERGEFFLPQLMASAEAAKAGFDTIRMHTPAGSVHEKGTIVLATVKGDIHDIGKNIVKMLLENYGYRIIDVGRDVEPQAVLDAVQSHGVKLVGLSALMTTSLRGMKDTIDLLRQGAPNVLIMVGGAVLNPEYAQMVGADFYAKDAAESARIAGKVFEERR